MEEKIVLDKDTFKALSQSNRINILKLLAMRNYTMSEIAQTLNYSNSTVKEHLEVMQKAGLITQIDSGHKWKYYKLTFKGRNVIEPREVKVLFAFAVSTLTAIGAGLYLLKPLLLGIFSKTAEGQLDTLQAAPMAAKMIVEAEPLIAKESILNIPLITLIISIFLAGITLGYLIKRKRIIIADDKDKEKGGLK